jgi:predicted PurR-regulated permease PerM
MSKFLSFVVAVFVLWIGRPLLLPLVMAVFLWYLTNALASYYNKWVRSRVTSGVMSGATLLGVAYLFAVQIQPMFGKRYAKMPEITAGANRILADLSALIGTEISFSDLPSVHGILAGIGSSMMDFGTAFGMILVYMVFIFFEQWTFSRKLRALFPAKRQFEKVSFILHSIDSHMKKYIAVKTWVGFLQGLCSGLIFWALGIDFAGVFGFIVFVLNYIPTIGSIIAGALPCVYVFALTGDLRVPLLAACGSVLVNFVFGNIMDTRMMGKTLSLSTMAILVNLVFWGLLWGPIGMFFSVPILAMLFVVCAQFDRLRWVAVLLSADGQIPEKTEER